MKGWFIKCLLCVRHYSKCRQYRVRGRELGRKQFLITVHMIQKEKLTVNKYTNTAIMPVYTHGKENIQ